MDKLSASPRIREALSSMKVESYLDAILHIPYRYEDFSLTPFKADYEDKERIVIYGKLASNVRVARFSHRDCTRFAFHATNGGFFNVEAWNRSYLGSFLKPGENYTLSGIYDKKRNVLSMLNLTKGEVSKEEALRPIYHLVDPIKQKSFQNLVAKAFEKVGMIETLVPEEFCHKYRLLDKKEALYRLHFPRNREDIRQGKRYLKYEEALLFELRCSLIRDLNRKIQKRRIVPIDREEVKSLIRNLDYKLTGDQKRALGEIINDMDGTSPMYRLLQGDVGSGKTLVAALACYANYTRGRQSALLAPTDTLARQHYENLTKLFEHTSVKVSLLTGAFKGSERQSVLDDLIEMQTDIVVGTHALFSKGVEYAALGLVVIDEQHKFGVNQRSALMGKGDDADLILMSATPIPRTLALTVFGDLDISTIREFPGGKRKVATSLLSTSDIKVQEKIKKAISSDHRVYIVAPEIESKANKGRYNSVKEVKALYERLYPGKVALLHGQMDAEAKQAALICFKMGISPILVATSLIEVGIDVKEANLMVVYEPTHFSLSSLHQLRGRIGRSGEEAEFLLLNDEEEENEKLKPLLESEDGFEIAEADLRLRGPGEVAGTRQAGLPDLAFSSILEDFKVFEAAREDAKAILLEKNNAAFDKIKEAAKEKMEDISLA